MAGFPGGLGVVRVQLAVCDPIVALPQPMAHAAAQVDSLITRIYNLGDSATLLDFDRGDGLACWVRARDIVSVDVTSTEDPGA